MVKDGRGKQADPGVMMLLVVPVEEVDGEGAGIFDGAETIRKTGPVFQGFELALRVRVIVGDMGAAMGFGDAQVAVVATGCHAVPHPDPLARRGDEDVGVLARALAKANPDRCVWASNWPHPNQNPVPPSDAMLDLLLEWTDDASTRTKILVDNPAKLYGF